MCILILYLCRVPSHRFNHVLYRIAIKCKNAFFNLSSLHSWFLMLFILAVRGSLQSGSAIIRARLTEILCPIIQSMVIIIHTIYHQSNLSKFSRTTVRAILRYQCCCDFAEIDYENSVGFKLHTQSKTTTIYPLLCKHSLYTLPEIMVSILPSCDYIYAFPRNTKQRPHIIKLHPLLAVDVQLVLHYVRI